MVVLLPSPLRSLLPWLLAAALLPAGCIHASAEGEARSPGITVENSVTVRFSERLQRFPFDPRELRLREASRQLAERSGHRVAFDIDVALLPQEEAAFHDALIDALQTLARDLEALAPCPPCLAYAPKTIAIRYDATATEGRPYRSATYDRETATLSIPVHPDEGLVPEGLLRAVLEDLRADDVVARFSGRDPAAIPAAEQREYLEYLEHGWTDLQTGAYRQESDPARIRKLVALHAAARDEALRADVRAELLPLARSSFTDWRWGHEAELAHAYPDAFAAYGGFLAKNAASLSPAERLEVAQTLYVVDHERRPAPSPPGFDAFAFGLRVIDEWLASASASPSHADPGTDAERERDALHGFVACPYIPHSSHPYCRDEAFYAWLWDTPEHRERLAKALRERASLELTRAAVQALAMARGHEAARELWRMLEDDPTAWAIATRVLGDDRVIGGHSPWVADELERLWRERPRQRGVLLYLLARSDPDGRQEAIWGRFARRFGARPSVRDLEQLLDTSPLAIGCLGGPLQVVDGSPVPAVLARLDRHLDAGGEPQGGYPPLPLLVRHLCDHGTPAERAAVHAHLTARLRDHASERAILRHPLDVMAPGGCR